jgi:hypothetical protein
MMKTATPTDLTTCSGEELLLIRILRPHVKGLIEQELRRRVGVRLAAGLRARRCAARALGVRAA